MKNECNAPLIANGRRSMTREKFGRPVISAFLAALIAGQVACGSTPQTEAAPTESGNAAASNETSNPHIAYTGEELFRGIMLGQGEVASRLPEVWGTAAMKSSIELAGTPDAAEVADQLGQMADRMASDGFASEGVQRVRDRAAAIRAMPPAALEAAARQSAGTGSSETRDALVEYIKTIAPTFFDAFRVAIESGNPVAVERALDLASKRIAEAGSSVRAPTADEADVAAALITFVAVVVIIVLVIVAPYKQISSPILRTRLSATIADRFAAK
jgi:hypothetical protein